jgi:hypothetical protein
VFNAYDSQKSKHNKTGEHEMIPTKEIWELWEQLPPRKTYSVTLEPFTDSEVHKIYIGQSDGSKVYKGWSFDEAVLKATKGEDYRWISRC